MNIKRTFISLFLVVPFIAFCRSEKIKKIKIGDFAPDFTLLDENKKSRSLKEFKNKKVVLYFYPQDDTPNCTLEACQLRDSFDVYKKNNIIILGVSYDSPESHKKFKAKNHLPFLLLSDSNKEVAKLYGAQKNLLGRFFPDRKTFLIDQNGKIIHIFKNVNVKTHSSDILNAFNLGKK